MKNDKQNLPKLADLHYAPELAFKNDALKLLLNQAPPESWVKPHPFAKNKGVPVPYISIGRIEFLLDKIFSEWRVEVLNSTQLFNSVAVTVRLHYRNPVDGTWSYHDGVGAVGVQTDQGESASNLNAIKADAVMKALPAAKSYAIKDACDHFGQLFGRNISRPDSFDFKGSYSEPTENTEEKRVIEWLKAGKMNIAELQEFVDGEVYAKYINHSEINELVMNLFKVL